MLSKSTLSDKHYKLKDTARVSDRLLQTLYIKAGLRPLDMYPSVDKSGRDNIVMIFDKAESTKYYEAWKNHTLAEILESRIAE